MGGNVNFEFTSEIKNVISDLLLMMNGETTNNLFLALCVLTEAIVDTLTSLSVVASIDQMTVMLVATSL